MEHRKIVTIGGGTGISTILRGLKKYTSDLTAIVTVGDDGGSSVMLREELGMLPPGDIRKCIDALAVTNPILHELINYRFQEGRLKGHVLGNLCLAALYGISDSFDEAVQKMNAAFGVEGRVLPVTTENIQLRAILEDGETIFGESKIGAPGHKNIKRLSLLPETPKPAPGVLEAIREADLIVIGPGSLYTSIIPNLLVEGVSRAICESLALKVYVGNIMTQPGETQGYTLFDHVQAIRKHGGDRMIDYVIANDQPIPEEILARYRQDGAEPVRIDQKRLSEEYIRLLPRDLVYLKDGRLIRHNYQSLASALMKL